MWLREEAEGADAIVLGASSFSESFSLKSRKDREALRDPGFGWPSRSVMEVRWVEFEGTIIVGEFNLEELTVRLF